MRREGYCFFCWCTWRIHSLCCGGAQVCAQCLGRWVSWLPQGLLHLMQPPVQQGRQGCLRCKQHSVRVSLPAHLCAGCILQKHTVWRSVLVVSPSVCVVFTARHIKVKSAEGPRYPQPYMGAARTCVRVTVFWVTCAGGVCWQVTCGAVCVCTHECVRVRLRLLSALVCICMCVDQ